MTRTRQRTVLTPATGGLAFSLALALSSAAWAQQSQQANQTPSGKGDAQAQQQQAQQDQQQQQQQDKAQQDKAQQNKAQQETAQQDKAQQDKAQQEQQQDQKAAEAQKQPRELKVFELQHRNPGEIQQLLNARPTSYPGVRQAVIIGRISSRPAELDQQSQTPPPAIAGDADSRALFARGTKEQLQQIEELVKAVDVPMDQFKPQTIGDKHLIPIHGDGTQRVLNTLTQLQLPHQPVQMGEGAIIVLCDDGSGDFQTITEQTQQVIAKLQQSQQDKQASGEGDSQQQQQNQQSGESKQ
jgi:hypothetical protein